MGRHGRFPEQPRPDGKKILVRISNETGGRLFEVSKKQSVDQIYSLIIGTGTYIRPEVYGPSFSCRDLA